MGERILTGLWSIWAQEAAALNGYAAWCFGGKHWVDQHPARAWEYALAIGALDEQAEALGVHHRRLILDVGGAGSPFAWIVAEQRHLPVQIIDPEFNGLGLGTALQGARTPLELRGKADFIACISVLEHIADTESNLPGGVGLFLVELADLLAPGGVLFLTVDYDPSDTPKDEFVYHWMRKRIYNEASFYGGFEPEGDSVRSRLARLGLQYFGGMCVGLDPGRTGAGAPSTIPGLGYTFASLCMRKET